MVYTNKIQLPASYTPKAIIELIAFAEYCETIAFRWHQIVSHLTIRLLNNQIETTESILKFWMLHGNRANVQVDEHFWKTEYLVSQTFFAVIYQWNGEIPFNTCRIAGHMSTFLVWPVYTFTTRLSIVNLAALATATAVRNAPCIRNSKSISGHVPFARHQRIFAQTLTIFSD